jgi:hypothetical protein
VSHVLLGATFSTTKGVPVTSGVKGSGWNPRAETLYVLRRWHTLSQQYWTTEQIAQDLGVKPRSLQQLVQRARRHGHPYATLHPLHVPAGHGVKQAIRTSHAWRKRTRERARNASTDAV